MASKYDDGAGVWRTVGGRRIFIKDGQSLSNAMKESGKFKKGSKKRESQDDFEKREARMMELAKKMDDMTDKGEDDNPEFEKMAEEYDKLLEENKEVEKKLISPNNENEKYNQKRDQNYRDYMEGKKDWNEYEKGIRESKLNEDEVTTKAQWKQDYGNNIEELERDLKNSEMYLGEPGEEGYEEGKKSLENGYEYLNELKEKQKSSNDDYKDDFYNKLSNEQKKVVDNAYKEGKKQYEEEKRIGEEYGKSLTNSKYNDYYKKENLGEPKDFKKGDNVSVQDEYSGKYGNANWKVVREATQEDKRGKINTNLKGYVLADDEGHEIVKADIRIKKNQNMNDAIRDKAFKQYEKEHPGSKTTMSNEESKALELSNKYRLKSRDWKESLNTSNYTIDDINHVQGSVTYNEIAYKGQDDLPFWERNNAFLSKEENEKMHDAYKTTKNAPFKSKEYRDAESYIQMMESKAASKYLDEAKKGTVGKANTAYKKAFQEYKKKHPNSKISLSKFIYMSEGN